MEVHGVQRSELYVGRGMPILRLEGLAGGRNMKKRKLSVKTKVFINPDDAIPDFLKIPQDVRNAVWEANPPRPVQTTRPTTTPIASPPRPVHVARMQAGRVK